MGAQQVHRAAVCAALVALTLPAIAVAGSRDEPVIVIDLRPGADLDESRAAFHAQLGQIAGIAPRRDGGVEDALAGEPGDTDGPALTAALDAARAAYGDLDCKTAAAHADVAIDLVAARQAAGLDDGSAARSGWAYALLCADHDGDLRRAQLAAQQLRNLGVTSGDDAGISAATWARYPEIDASTDRDIVALTVDTAAGATVWVDHAAVGVAPVTVYVAAGEHVVAASDGPRRSAGRVTVAGKPVTAKLELVDRTGAYSSVAAVVKGWRDGSLTPTAESLGTVMDALGVRFALILAGRSTVQVWGRGPRDDLPRKIDDAPVDDVMAIGSMITDRVAAWDGRSPDPDLPLLVESPEDRATRDRGTPNRWWVYAAIVGAVVLGTTVLYLQDTADDRQTITVSF